MLSGELCASLLPYFFVQFRSLLDTLDIEIFVDSLGSGLADLSAGEHAWKGSEPHGKEQGSAEWKQLRPREAKEVWLLKAKDQQVGVHTGKWTALVPIQVDWKKVRGFGYSIFSLSSSAGDLGPGLVLSCSRGMVDRNGCISGRSPCHPLRHCPWRWRILFIVPAWAHGRNHLIKINLRKQYACFILLE